MSSSGMMQFEARRKSAGVAYALWFLLGWLGMHRFYSGRVKSGLMQLVLGVGALVVFVMSFVGGVGASMAGDQASSDAASGVAGIAFLVWAVVGLWIFIDLFLVAGWIRRYNIALAEDYSQPRAET